MTEPSGVSVFPSIAPYFREQCTRHISSLNKSLNSAFRYLDAEVRDGDEEKTVETISIESDSQLLNVFDNIAEETKKLVESFQPQSSTVVSLPVGAIIKFTQSLFSTSVKERNLVIGALDRQVSLTFELTKVYTSALQLLETVIRTAQLSLLPFTTRLLGTLLNAANRLIALRERLTNVARTGLAPKRRRGEAEQHALDQDDYSQVFAVLDATDRLLAAFDELVRVWQAHFFLPVSLSDAFGQFTRALLFCLIADSHQLAVATEHEDESAAMNSRFKRGRKRKHVVATRGSGVASVLASMTTAERHVVVRKCATAQRACRLLDVLVRYCDQPQFQRAVIATLVPLADAVCTAYENNTPPGLLFDSNTGATLRGADGQVPHASVLCALGSTGSRRALLALIATCAEGMQSTPSTYTARDSFMRCLQLAAVLDSTSTTREQCAAALQRLTSRMQLSVVVLPRCEVDSVTHTITNGHDGSDKAKVNSIDAEMADASILPTQPRLTAGTAIGTLSTAHRAVTQTSNLPNVQPQEMASQPAAQAVVGEKPLLQMPNVEDSGLRLGASEHTRVEAGQSSAKPELEEEARDILSLFVNE